MPLTHGSTPQRVLHPAPSAQPIRGRYRQLGVEEKTPRRLLLRHEVTIDIEGENRPALIAETLGMIVLEPASTKP
jgi:hypothetical protein